MKFVLRFISFIRIISFICIFTGLLCEEKTHENKFDTKQIRKKKSNQIKDEDSDNKDNPIHSSAEIWIVEDRAAAIENDKIKPTNTFNLISRIVVKLKEMFIFIHMIEKVSNSDTLPMQHWVHKTQNLSFQLLNKPFLQIS